MRVNYWQAQKRIQGIEAIREDVQAWDVSALSPLYRAAKPLLLDDFDAAFAAIPELIEQEDVKRRELHEWPLFKEARAHERWTEIETLLPPLEKDDEREDGAADASEAEEGGKADHPKGSREQDSEDE